MLSHVFRFLLGLAALVFTGVGISALVFTPFLPLAFFDTTPPSWLNRFSFFLLGAAALVLGIWFWILAWRRYMPMKEKK